MTRPVVALVFAVALILAVIGLAPVGSVAQGDPATPTSLVVPECTNDLWKWADVRPPDPDQASVIPAAVATPGADERELYLVMVTLPPLPAEGACMPFYSVGNQRDGAVVWIVQEGVVAFTWDYYAPGTSPNVVLGHQTTLGDVLPPNIPVLLHKGDWVTQDQRIKATYTNMGDDSAIIWKAVFAKPEGGGCHGDCKG